MAQEELKSIIMPQIDTWGKHSYIIYGTGEVAKLYQEELEKLYGKDAVVYFINGTTQKIYIGGKPILHYSELSSIEVNKYKYVLATLSKSAYDMKSRLVEYGVEIKNIMPEITYFNSAACRESAARNKNIVILPEFTSKKEVIDFENIMKKYMKYEIGKKIHCFCLEDNDKNKEIIGNLEIHFRECNLEDEEKVVLVRNMECLMPIISVYRGDVFCIDESFIRGSFHKMISAINEALIEDNVLEKREIRMRQNFIKMQQMAKETVGVGIFGTGPSLGSGVEKYKDLLNKTFNIVCNNAYRLEHLMEILEPSLYVLSDMAFLKDNRSGMKEIIEYVEKHNCFLAINKDWASIVLEKYSISENKIVTFEFVKDEVIIPTEKNRKVCILGSVILTMAFPIAISFKNRVFVLGCDGADIKRENTTWNYEKGADMDAGVIDKRNRVFGSVDSKSHNVYTFFPVLEKGYEKIFQNIGSTKIYNLTHSYFEELEKYYVEDFV